MSNQQDSHWIFDRDYCGRILKGEFGNDLKKRVAEAISLFRSFNVNANPSIPYISAWRENSDKSIWYEFVGNRLLQLLGCQSCEVSEIFRDSVLQRLTYHYGSDSGKINKKILEHKDLALSRTNCAMRGKARAPLKLFTRYPYKTGRPSG